MIIIVILAIFCLLVSSSIGGGIYAMSVPWSGGKKWSCQKDNQEVAVSEIWWGFKEADGKWACNEWNKERCNNACTAKML